ncbi:DUF305 domain-containing protein [Thalassiella azotivora]
MSTVDPNQPPDDEATNQGGGGRATGMSRAVLAAVVIIAVAVAAAGGLLAGSRLAAGPAASPGTESVDAGFARDMQAHHMQAVQMSMLLLEGSSDVEVRTLARDILLTQQQQVGQMHGWLELWDLPQTTSRPAMEWMPDTGAGMSGMDHGSPPPTGGDSAVMPGMASTQDLRRLEESAGSVADRLFLQLMIPHHEGGVAMGEAAARSASQPQVRHLARTIVDSQTSELKVLQEMLTARGGPVTS